MFVEHKAEGEVEVKPTERQRLGAAMLAGSTQVEEDRATFVYWGYNNDKPRACALGATAIALGFRGNSYQVVDFLRNKGFDQDLLYAVNDTHAHLGLPTATIANNLLQNRRPSQCS